MRFNNPTKRDDRPRHLIRHFLRLGYCATLLGKRYSGKSDLATAIALAVAEGTTFAGMPATQGGVLWLSSEDPYDHERTLRPLRARLETLPFFVTYDRPAIDTAEGLHDISDGIAKARARLIVVDSLDAAHSRGIGWDARATLAPFKKLCYQNGVTGLLLHTIKTKDNPLIEAAHFAAATDMSILCAAQESNSGRLITLQGIGRGHDANATWQLLNPDRFEYRVAPTPNQSEAVTPKFMLDDEVFECIARAPEPLSATNISDRLDRNPNSIRNAIARLIASGKVYCSHHANRSRHFRVHREKMSELNLQESASR